MHALDTHGRWAFAEFTDRWQMQVDFKARFENEFNSMITSATVQRATRETP